MIEIAALVTSGLTSAVGLPAVQALLKRAAQELLSKGIPAQEIQTLQEAQLSDHIGNQEELLTRARHISRELSPKDEYVITATALSEAHEVTNNLRGERLRQARAAFNAALLLMVVGILIIFGGVALVVFREAVTGGAVTTAVGAVVEVVSALLFKFSNDAQNRLDDMGRHLNAIEAAQVAVNLIAKIEDPGKRDDAVREAATVLAGLGSMSPKPSPKG